MTPRGRSTVFAPNGAAATSHPLATAEAVRVLQGGGNAVDAAVAAAAVLGVVEPNMTGPGGDAFAQVWWARDRSLHVLDASGRTGSLATPEALAAAGGGRMPERGPATVSVPGAVSGWSALLDRFGTSTLAEALATAIDLAEGGFPVSPVIAEIWAPEVPTLARDPGACATFLVDGRRAPAPGEWFRNPDMGAALAELASDGPEALYGGALGTRLVEGLRSRGGLLTLDDLAAHAPRWVEPLSCEFRGHRVWQAPPAGQGIAVLQMLGMLDGLDLEARGHNTADYLHLLIEAKKLAFADLEGHVADADHMVASPAAMLDDGAIAARRARIDLDRASPGPPPGEYGRDTVYLAVGDRHGNLVSFINSIYWNFGSGIVVPGTGIPLQNRGGAQVLDPGHPNCVAPRKRTLHTIIPAMLTRDDEAVMAFGVVGRSMQPQGQVQLLLNLLLFDMDLQEAVEAPRFRHTEGMDVALEPGIGPDVRTDLARRGHRLVPEDDVFFGSAQVVRRLPRGWAAASDPRRDGCALGH